jgi:hypothetical protein
MNRNLLGNLEDETPVVLVQHDYKKLGRGLFGLLLMAVFAMMLPVSGWAQHPFTLTTPDDVTNHSETLYWMESVSADGFYAIPHTDNSSVSTTNMPNLKALWYFMDAGIESSIQYYYIVNHNTGYYLKLTGTIGNDNTIKIASFGSGGDAFKFSVGGSEGQWIFYPKSGNGNYWVNKKSGNVPYDRYFKSSNWGGSPDGNSKWNIVARNSVTWAHPFTNSTNSEKHYYYIHNASSSTYYMSADDASDPYATVSNVNDDKRIWYFMEAASDNTIPNLKYYYIVNAITGKYLKFTGTANGNEQADKLQLYVHDGTETGDTENRFQFMILNAKGDAYSAYAIMPKLEISYYYNKSASLSPEKNYSNSLSNGKKIGIYNDRGQNNNYAHWYIEIADVEVEAPEITYDNVNQEINITCGTEGVSIYYTLDGSTPTSGSTQYNGPVSCTSPCTINAIAVKSIFLSDVTTYNLQKVATPTFSLNTNTNEVTITSTTGASIYYSIGAENTPSIGDNPYTAPFEFPYAQSNQPLKAIAVKEGWINSDMGQQNIMLNCYMPTFSFDNGTQQVTLACDDAEATMYYTTNGDTPVPGQSGTTQYTGTPFGVTTGGTVKAIAVHTPNYNNSNVAELSITQVATPTIQNNGSNAVSITSATEGATIYYEINGTPVVGSSPIYSEPLRDEVSGQTINAIAVKENMINSAMGTGTVTLQCEGVNIRRSGGGFVITCEFPNTGVTIYYEIAQGNGIPNTPNTSTSPSVPSGQTIPYNYEDFPITVTAIATASYYSNSTPTTTYIEQGLNGSGTLGDPYLIESQDDVVPFIETVNDDGASACYKVTATTLDFSSTSEITQDFSGNFDGNFCVITGLEHALFNTVDGGTVKNVTLKNVDISSSADAVGAIAGTAKGYSRIYNCGILPNSPDFPAGTHPTVTTTGSCAGGIVGSLEDDSRVVNCFSYADVSSSGYAAGIVGNNTFASTAEVVDGKYTKLRTMVVNCMFYGDITAGSNVWPVYGGEKIINGGGRGADISDGYYAINNYNFYSDSCSFPEGKEPSTTHIYNCSWPAKYEYLTRYEFHRYLLNSNRELCGWWVGAPQAPSTMSTTDVQAVAKDATLMAKWVLDRSVAPFPILKPFGYYHSPINIDADASWRESANEWEGKKMGKVSVTVNPGNHAPTGITTTTTPLEINITDMDTLRGDFCYRKIQLPYYNNVFGNPNSTDWTEKYAGNYKDYVVTGWDITSVTGGTTGEFVQNWESGYNFADRNCTEKDMHRTFAQGGYYYVPNGVTAIEIKAHWGKAVYLGNGDNYYDRVDLDYLVEKNSGSNTGGTTIRENRPGTAFEPAGTRPSTLGNGQPIRTGKIYDVATSYLQNSGTVFDNALVLVGNHQYCTGDWNVNPSRRFTIMSADFDLDNEPDYCLEWQLGKGVSRFEICPIRFDFLPVVEIGLGLKKDGSTQYYSLGCYHPKGHFEVTETALIRFGQFEFSNRRTTECPIILNGGIFDQYVRGTTGAENTNKPDKITYIILGGNLKMLSFTPGAHVNNSHNYSTRHCAVNVIGGRFESLYLSGNFNESVTPYADNPHCYIDGGWFSHVAAAGKEGINGDVTFKINHSVIYEFYGGGVMMGHEVTGSIDVTIDNSLVNKYCGGPKFGDMTSGKTVTTSATGTTFGVYYGAGNGGTNYVQYTRTDGTYYNNNGFDWNGNGSTGGHINSYSPGAYRNAATGYQANYDMELINVSTGTFYDCAVNRTYFYAAQYAATNTGEVNNTLDSCIVLGNFYGAGNLGGVNGNVTSKLTDTEVRGSAFGGGYSASIPKVQIYKKDKQVPVIDLYTGSITPQKEGTYDEYTWTNDPSLSTSNPSGTINGKPCYYTEISLDSLGTVRGNVSLTIEGKSTIGSYVNGVLKPDSGNVFGGGHESLVTGNTEVKIFGKTKVFGNIYGGGNMGLVGGNTNVIINGKYTGTSTGTNSGGN